MDRTRKKHLIMSELLLELFSEEIPAMMQANAAGAFEQIFSSYFNDNELTFTSVKAYVGPRRLAIHVQGLQTIIEEKRTTLKGPKTSSPDAAISGFCKSNQITLQDLSKETINDTEYFTYEKITPRKETYATLKECLPDLITSYVWPKSMLWGNYQLRWVRPLVNVLCIFDGKVVDFALGHLKANNRSYGHRFMSPSSFIVNNFNEYKKQLEDNFVILDQKVRQEYIIKEATKLAANIGFAVKQDDNLLEELTGLAEYPQVLIGTIDSKFLTVPSVVLVSSMKTHQKYFSLIDANGNFAPYFIFVSNIKSTDESTVINGNQKVLSARLSDALYFYKQDLQSSLKSKASKLENIIFHAKIGTLAEKVKRIESITRFLYNQLHNHENNLPSIDELTTASTLCKNDIVSEVVNEFPNLQGIMGYYYAKNDNLSEEIAISIRDHYKPQGPNDTCPTKGAAIVAIADKIDSLCSLMMAGEKPTGSKDPFALRRLALGVIRIIMENSMHIDLREVVKHSLSLFGNDLHKLKHSNYEDIILFIEERTKHLLKDKYDHKLISSVLNLSNSGYLDELNKKLVALQKFLDKKDSQDLVICYKRANNILANKVIKSTVNSSLFDNKNEQELYTSLQNLSPILNKEIDNRNYDRALEVIQSLKNPVSNFFDNVLVNVENTEVAENRLALLNEVKNIFDKIANFDQL